MRVSVDKPGTPEELVLEHHGVKGMKWGHRLARSSAAKKATNHTVQRHYARRSARTTRRAFDKKHPTALDRRDAIYRARVSDGEKFTKSILETDPKKRAQARKVYLNNPDRATALRMTRGEKVTAGLVAGIFAVPSAGIVPAVIGLSVGARVAQRHHIEKKQARGGFK